MKKSILSIAAVVMVSVSQAQITIGPEGSFIFSNYQGKQNGQNLGTTAVPGFRAGWVVDIPLSARLSLQPALLYVTNGSRLTTYEGAASLNSGAAPGTTVNTLEVPANLLCKFRLGRVCRFFAGAGPYIARNIDGESKFTSECRNDQRDKYRKPRRRLRIQAL